MIESAITYIQTIIDQYGAWGVFLATIIEEIVAPIPSALVPLAGGFFLLTPDAGFMEVALQSIALVAFPVALGIALGSSAVYAITYYGGKPFIERYQRLLGIRWADIERMNERFMGKRSDEVTLFVLRLIPIIPGVALSGFCGIVRYPFTRFLVITFLGSFVRAFALGLVGWKAGEFYAQYLVAIDRIEGYVLGVIIVLLLVWGAIHYIRKQRS